MLADAEREDNFGLSGRKAGFPTVISNWKKNCKLKSPKISLSEIPTEKESYSSTECYNA